MKRLSLLWPGLTAVMAISLAGSGCSKGSRMMSAGSSRLDILSVRPVVGAVDVPVTAKIEIAFNAFMDTNSVRANLCLIGGEQMQQMMDSLAGMHSAMDYSRIMQMMHQMSMPGHFGWNSGKDSCQFWPDSAMQHNTQYMIFMGRDMMGAGGHMGDQNQMMGSDWISHFTTSP